MKITNNFNLPEQFVEAVNHDTYSKDGSDYSGSELINPVQVVILKNRHASEIVQDASDMVWLAIGKAAHVMLEQSTTKKKNILKEMRIHDTFEGRKISGQIDLYDEDEKRLSDWKITSVWTAMFGSRVKEWTEQQNIYRYLLEKEGFEVSVMEIVAIYRDWSLSESKRYGEKYPPKVETVKLEVWSLTEIKNFIVDKIVNLVRAEQMTDDQLPECSPEERWQKSDSWAVMKTGNVKATKVEPTFEAAETYRLTQKKPSEFSTVKREGEWTRCEYYCPVNSFCSQFKKYKAQVGPVEQGVGASF